MEVQQKKTRTIQDVQQEYTGLCTKLGHLTYQIATLAKDADMIKETLKELNFEASEISAREAKEKADAATPVVAEEVK